MHPIQEDKQALYELMCRYCHAVDRKAFDQLRELYLPDAIHDHGTMFKGDRESYIEFLKDSLHGMTTQHMVGNHLYHVEQNYAEGEVYTVNYHVFHRPEGDIEYVAGGRYIDHYLRDRHGWRIKFRKRFIDWSRQGEPRSNNNQALQANDDSQALLTHLYPSDDA